MVTVTTPEEEPKVPPRGQRYNPFNKAPEVEAKAVPGSRHRKFIYVIIINKLLANYYKQIISINANSRHVGAAFIALAVGF